MAQIFGQLEKAQLENTTSDTGSLPKGMITYRTDLNLAKVSNGTSMLALVDDSSAQTLTNKTLTSAILTGPQITSGGALFTQIATPSTPSAGINKVYTKSDGNMYILGSDGIEKQIGSGGSGTGKNYLGNINNVDGNGNFELGSTSKWSLFNTTLTSLIPTGSITAGAASFTTFTATTSGKLAGTYSLSVAGSGAFTAGQGFITDAFTIDTEDQAKAFSFKFSFSVISGASNLNFSGTSANTFAVYVYDVTNSLWIQPAGVYSMTQNSGVGIAQGTFQTSYNGTQYRLAVVCINASAGASSLLFDSFSFGPNAVVQGTPISDWQSYTPTLVGVGTATNVASQWRRVGSNIEIRGSATTGTATGVPFSISLPSGVSIDSAKLTISANTTASPGNNVGMIGANNATNGTSGHIVTAPGTSTSLVYAGTRIGNLATHLTPTNANTLFENSVVISWQFSIPVLGWGSSVTMSNDTDTRVVAMKAQLNSFTHSSSGAVQTITGWSTAEFDTHGAFNSSTGIFTVPVSGVYKISTAVAFNNDTTGVRYAQFNKNGAVNVYTQQIGASVSAASVGVVVVGETLISCVAGDTLSIGAYQTSGGSLGLLGGGSTHLSIQRLSGPSQVAASETVSARIYGSTQTIGTAAAVVVMPTKEFDTHGAYNTSTGLFTVPVAGKYRITAHAAAGSSPGSASTNRRVLMRADKNAGTLYYMGVFLYQSTAGAEVSVNGSITLDCKAGDTLALSMQRAADVTSFALSGAQGDTWVTFEKVG